MPNIIIIKQYAKVIYDDLIITIEMHFLQKIKSECNNQSVICSSHDSQVSVYTQDVFVAKVSGRSTESGDLFLSIHLWTSRSKVSRLHPTSLIQPKVTAESTSQPLFPPATSLTASTAHSLRTKQR